jgi:hypothetical protein
MVDGRRQIPADVRSVVRRLSDRDWESLTLQLGRYALHKSRRFYWRTGRSGELPNGEPTESLVSKAFVLWLTGRRRWNRAEYEDLPAFLRSVIDSLLSHSANGYDNRHVASEPELDRPAQGTPEVELLSKERAAEADRMVADIEERSQGDVVALAIIDAIRNGAATRRAVVQDTGYSPEAIDNGLKRLRRIGAAVARVREDRT